MKWSLESFRNRKFVRDVGFSSMATVGVSVAVLAINTLVGRFYGVSALGLYNTVLSIYIVMSILSVVGVPNSILKKAAELKGDPDRLSKIFVSGFLLSGILSFVFVSTTYVVLKFGMLGIDSKLLDAFLIMLPAVWFSSINKTCRAFFNGIRDIKSYSLVDLVKWIGILCFVTASLLWGRPFEFIFHGFLIIEGLVAVGCLARVTKYAMFFKPVEVDLVRSHFHFGIRSALGSSLLIVNDRLTILLLAFFLPARDVGFFSLAFEVSRGLLAFGTVVQANFNPIISKLTSSNDLTNLQHHIKRIQGVMSQYAIVSFFGAVVAFPLYIFVFMGGVTYLDSVWIFYILLIGSIVGIRFFWIGGILTMAGHPSDSIVRNIIFLFSTIVFNWALIPLFGVYGAAVATAATYFVRIFTLRLFVFRRLGFRLF